MKEFGVVTRADRDKMRSKWTGRSGMRRLQGLW